MSALNTPSATAPADGAVRYPGMLTRGATGKPVRVLQERLSRHGHRLDIDGEFGPATVAAVRRFQANHGIEVDGATASPVPRPSRASGPRCDSCAA
jgi:zinc D-Ala-D-Ala carboxypeptidase